MTGKEVKKLRKSIGLTRKEFAYALGIQGSNLSRWETSSKALTKSMENLVTLTVEKIRERR